MRSIGQEFGESGAESYKLQNISWHLVSFFFFSISDPRNFVRFWMIRFIFEKEGTLVTIFLLQCSDLFSKFKNPNLQEQNFNSFINSILVPKSQYQTVFVWKAFCTLLCLSLIMNRHKQWKSCKYQSTKNYQVINKELYLATHRILIHLNFVLVAGKQSPAERHEIMMCDRNVIIMKDNTVLEIQIYSCEVHTSSNRKRSIKN